MTSPCITHISWGSMHVEETKAAVELCNRLAGTEAPFGKNKVIASDLFADYLTRFDVMSALSARVGAPVARNDATALVEPAMSAFVAVCETGRAMPSFVEMPAVWGHLALAEVTVIGGGDPEAACRHAADGIRRLVG